MIQFHFVKISKKFGAVFKFVKYKGAKVSVTK